MSEYYVSCSFYNFRQLVDGTTPNQKGEYKLECQHLYCLYPDKEEIGYYLEIYLPNECGHHLTKVTDNLRYQLNEPDLILKPKTAHVPYASYLDPIFATGEHWSQFIHQLLVNSEEIFSLTWKDYFHVNGRESPITYYLNVETEMGEFSVILKNFWSGQIKDLEKAVQLKKQMEEEPFKYLKRHPVSLIKFNKTNYFMNRIISHFLANHLNYHCLEIVINYYNKIQKDAYLPHPRNVSSNWL